MKLVFAARVWRRGYSQVITIPAKLIPDLKAGDWVAVAVIGPFRDHGVPMRVMAELDRAISEVPVACEASDPAPDAEPKRGGDQTEREKE